MWHFKQSVWFWILFCLLSSSCQGRDFDFATQQLLIISNGDKESARAADYLFRHLDKRNSERTIFQVDRSDVYSKEFKGGIVYVEIVGDLESDYEIVNEYGRLSLFGRDPGILRWLSYMLIDRLGDCHKLDRDDIPPNYLEFKTRKGYFAFGYREPHLQPNMDQDLSGILLTHNVDRDWGLWGHNLSKVFAGGGDSGVMALVDGIRDKDQYCFSSEKTFQAIKAFIIEEYGHGLRGATWFMVAPNDNDKVCTCTSCRKQGNTAKSASGAVAVLLNRLTEEFPHDHFYTMAYRTTSEAPKIRLADRAGVLLSTIDLPKSPRLERNAPSVQKFITLLKSWNEQTFRIYLWDYISNFDDYITPFPVLRRVQAQLTYFRELGINGLFLNGSGYDYSPFDDVKTYVLSAIMIDPSLSVSDLVRRYHKRFYPHSAELLTQYLLEIEDNAYNDNRDIAIYSSFRQSMKTYFDTERFSKFYTDLELLVNDLQGNEGYRVRTLLNVLSYTKLQLDYHNGDVADGFLENQGGILRTSHRNDTLIHRLDEALEEGVVNYKEEKGALKSYLKEWKRLKGVSKPFNRFKVSKAIGISSADVIESSGLLCDNKVGFVSDFNQGWFLVGEDVRIIGRKQGEEKEPMTLEMTFLLNARHRMSAPERIELWSTGNKIMQFSTNDFSVFGDLVTLKKKINLLAHSDLEIRIYKNKGLKKSVIACDEIQLY